MSEFNDSFRRVINMADPQPNSLISKDNPPPIKILADWGRKACDIIVEMESESNEDGIACNAYGKQVAELQAELDQHRWIPVSERLPEDNAKKYLWYCNKPDKEFLLFGDPEFFYEGDYNFTHWKPIVLPKDN